MVIKESIMVCSCRGVDSSTYCPNVFLIELRWRSAITTVSSMLFYYRKHPKFALPMFRKWPERGLPPLSMIEFTYGEWETTKNTLDRLGVGRRASTTDLEEIYNGWESLGQILELLESRHDGADRNVLDFEPLKRCGWRHCPCSVHLPTHPMKVCKACWTVAYCSERCQKRWA